MTSMTHAQHFSHGRVHRSDDLFQLVDPVVPEPAHIDAPEVSESDWGAFDEACGGDQPMFHIVTEAA